MLLRFALPIALLITNCPQPTVSAPDGPQTLEFQSLPYEQVPEFSVQGGDGEIVVRDRIITGVCHSREVQEARLEGDTVTLRIAHPLPPGNQACIALGKLGAYRARISGLSPGSYQLVVRYEGEVKTETHPRPDLNRTVLVR